MSESPNPAAPSAPSSDFLYDLLGQLQPPHLPVSPHLLSTDLKTRHLYLPPTEDQPDAYIKQRPDANDAGKHAIYDALEHIASEWEAVEQQGGQHAGLIDRIGGRGSEQYLKVDEHTVFCRLELSAPDLGHGRGAAVEIKVIHEGSAGWLLYDTELIRSAGSSGQTADWAPSLDAAHMHFAKSASEKVQRNPRPEELDDDDEEDANRWDGNGTAGDPRGGAEDFWGGYSDDEKKQGELEEPGTAPERGRSDDLSFTPNRARGETIKASDRVPVVPVAAPHSTAILSTAGPSSTTAPLPASSHNATSQAIYPSTLAAAPPLSRQTSGSSSDFGAGDTYWSAYAGVEDGLRASNPPSRIGSVRDLTMMHMTPRAPQDGRFDSYGGTGANIPVRWTPEPMSEKEEGDAKTPPTGQNEAGAADPLPSIPKPNGSMSTAEEPADASRSDAERALEGTLRGLLAVYAGQGEARSAAKVSEFWEIAARLQREA